MNYADNVMESYMYNDGDTSASGGYPIQQSIIMQGGGTKISMTEFHNKVTPIGLIVESHESMNCEKIDAEWVCKTTKSSIEPTMITEDMFDKLFHSIYTKPEIPVRKQTKKIRIKK